MNYNSLQEVQNRSVLSFINFNESFWLTLVYLLLIVIGIWLTIHITDSETKKNTESLREDGKVQTKDELQKFYFRNLKINSLFLLVIFVTASLFILLGGGTEIKYNAINKQAFQNIDQKYGEDKVGNTSIEDYGKVIKAEGTYYSFEDNTSTKLEFAFDAKGEPHIMMNENVDKELIKKIENEAKK